jgi:hypothetical protein
MKKALCVVTSIVLLFSSGVSTYYLYRYEDSGSGLTYNLLQSNSTGDFTINDFYSDEVNYISNYYLRGQSALGCWSSYFNVDIDVMRPAMPAVTGDTEVCYDQSTLLTASGGYEGSYRWYLGANIIPGETGSQYNTGNVISAVPYYVSYVEEGYSGGQCESPRRQVNIDIVPLPGKPSAINPALRRCGAGMMTLEVWGPYNDFQWYDANDQPVSGATSATYAVQVDELNTEEVYKVKGISAEGCESELTMLSATAVSDCENYVHDEVVNVRGITSENQLTSLTADEKGDTRNYFDGLGKPVQTIGMQVSPDLRDIISVSTYDDLGRAAESVLPYTSMQTDGKFRSTALTEIYDYYANNFGDNSPAAVTIFDKSPLGRVVEQGGVGDAWQPNSAIPADGKTRKFLYGTNDAGDEVLNWTITSADNSEAVTISSSPYPSNTLEESIIVDDANPDHSQTVTYKDLMGHTALQKSQLDGAQWAETYYVYDKFGQLRAVLPPKAVQTIKDQSLTVVSGSILDEYAFLYLYDNEGRRIAEKSPGISWVYNVYDKLGQLVLRQDGNQRTGNQWTFHKYDGLGRPVLTGLVTLTASVDQIRADVVNHAVTFEDRGNVVLHYTNNAYPDVSDANAYLKADYYDDIKTVPEAYSDLADAEDLPASVLQQMDDTQTNKGLIGHEKIRILGTALWTETSYFYDKYHNNVFTVTKETTTGGSREIRYATERFHNDVSNELEKLITTANTGKDEISVVKRFEYDHADRLQKEYYRVDKDGLQPEIIAASYEYNELGQLVDKKIHSTDNGSTWLQSEDYRYNIQDALTTFNSLNGDAGENDYFGFDLAFDAAVPNAGNTARYDGLVSAMRWNDDLTSKEKLYNFGYDGLNRLTSSDYQQGVSGTWSQNAQVLREQPFI